MHRIRYSIAALMMAALSFALPSFASGANYSVNVHDYFARNGWSITGSHPSEWHTTTSTTVGLEIPGAAAVTNPVVPGGYAEFRAILTVPPGLRTVDSSQISVTMSGNHPASGTSGMGIGARGPHTVGVGWGVGAGRYDTERSGFQDGMSYVPTVTEGVPTRGPGATILDLRVTPNFGLHYQDTEGFPYGAAGSNPHGYTWGVPATSFTVQGDLEFADDFVPTIDAPAVPAVNGAHGDDCRELHVDLADEGSQLYSFVVHDDVTDETLASTDWLLDDQHVTTGHATKSLDLCLDWSEGAHELRIEAVDRAGQTTSVTRGYTVDLTAPLLSSTHVQDSAVAEGTSIAFAAADLGSGIAATSVSFDGGGAMATGGSSFSVPGGLAPGAHAARVVATDAAGNASQLELRFVIPQPVVLDPPRPTDPEPTKPAPVVFTGGSKGDTKSGGSLADVLRGNGGNDKLFGRAGNDKLFGGVGNDVLDGGVGNDTLDGGAGNDKLTGGPGSDTLLGGVGADTISAKDGVRDTVNCGAARDVAVVDKIDKVSSCETVKRS